MPFFSSGFWPPLRAPGTDVDEDWVCLCIGPEGKVVAGSTRAAYCVVDTVLEVSLGYWRGPPDMTLEDMQYCHATREIVALEKDREFLHLVVYLPQWDGITDASTMIRHSIPLGCTQAAIRGVVFAWWGDDFGRTTESQVYFILSFPQGHMDLFECGAGKPPIRIADISPSTSLGVSPTYYQYAALQDEVLVVGTSTDVWILPVPRHNSEDNPAVTESSVVATQQNAIQDVPDLLECVLSHDMSCVRTMSYGNQEPAPILAHLSYSAKWPVTNVFFAGIKRDLLFVVAGKELQIYDVPQLQGSSNTSRAGVSARAVLAFNAQALHVAISGSQEYPWLFALTVLGIEVWSLPLLCADPSHEGLEPCRVLIQRLEYHQQLERLPPLAMVVTASSLVLLPNPPNHTPKTLSLMLFHALPRPPAGRAPELDFLDEIGSQPVSQVPPSSLLVFRMEPLATVYKFIRAEVLHDLKEGIVRSAVEFMDSSTVVLPVRVGHESRLDILKNMHALLVPVGHLKQETAPAVGDIIGRIERRAAEERATIYSRLSQACASQIGDLCLRPPDMVTVEDVRAACQWYARSDTPIGQVWASIKSLQPTDIGKGIEWTEALLDYLEATLLMDQQDSSSAACSPPYLFIPRGTTLDSKQVDLVLQLAKVFADKRRGRLPALILSPKVPWAHNDGKLRDAARDLLDRCEETVETRLARLALVVWDMRALVEGQEIVQVDKSTNTPSVITPTGFQQRLDEFLSLSRGLGVDDIVQVCRCAEGVILKSVPIQGLSLVLKGPLFDYLETNCSEILAQLLAEMTWGDKPAFDMVQVLRLLGPYGTVVANDLVSYVGHPNQSHSDIDTWVRKAGSTLTEKAPAKSRMLVRHFLEARLKTYEEAEAKESNLSPCGLSRQRFLVAELLDLYLVESKLSCNVVQSPEPQVMNQEGLEPWITAVWSTWTGCLVPPSPATVALMKLLTRRNDSLDALRDWKLIWAFLSSQMLDDKPEGGSAISMRAAGLHLARLVCLAGLEQLEEAFDLLLEMLVKQRIHQDKASSSSDAPVVLAMSRIVEILYGFTKHVSPQRTAWHRLLDRIRMQADKGSKSRRKRKDRGNQGGAISNSDKSEFYHQLHLRLIERLALDLSPPEFLGSLPDDGLVSEYLAAIETNLLPDHHLASRSLSS